MTGESIQAQSPAAFLQEEEVAQVDRLSALEHRVEENRAEIARLKNYVDGLKASYERVLTSMARILKEGEENL